LFVSFLSAEAVDPSCPSNSQGNLRVALEFHATNLHFTRACV